MKTSTTELNHITQLLKKGEIIACPTEGVFGFSCDPFNEAAVKKLLDLKKRSIEKGLILIISNWDQITPYLTNLEPAEWERIQTTTVHPTTWIVPVNKNMPTWITGSHASVAVRLVGHPTARALCEAFGAPLVSTSANISEEPACLTYQEVETLFKNKIAYIVKEETLNFKKPSQIVEAKTGKIIRCNQNLNPKSYPHS